MHCLAKWSVIIQQSLREGEEASGKQLPSTVSPGPMRTNFLPHLCHAKKSKDACSRFRNQAASEWRGKAGQSMKSQSYKRHLGSFHLPRGPTTPWQFACFLFLPSLVAHLFTAFHRFHKAYHSLLCTCAHLFCVGHSGDYQGCSGE